jgi:hypothetical protein
MPGKVIEGTRVAIGGWILRPYIQRVLAGKDWFESITVWAMILVLTAEQLVSQMSAYGLLSEVYYDQAVFYLQRTGEILVILGVRRAKARS